MRYSRAFFTLIALSSTALATAQAFADESIQFSEVDQNIDVAKAACFSNEMTSDSTTANQTQTYRTTLSSKQVRDIASGRKRIDFQPLATKVSLHAKGDGALSEVQKIEMTVSFKDRTGKVLSTTLVRWSTEDSSALVDLALHRDHFEFIDQGAPSCEVSGPSLQSKKCEFVAMDSLAKSMKRQNMIIAKMYRPRRNNRLNSGLRTRLSGRLSGELIVDVSYQTVTYSDCVGTASKAFAFGSSTRPQLILRGR
jgi:hypothetical protein